MSISDALVDVASVSGLLVGIGSIGLSIYLIVRVGRLEAARAQERELLQEILPLDKLSRVLMSVSRDDAVRDREAIAEAVGHLNGVLKTLRKLHGTADLKVPVHYVGYYEEGFQNEIVGKAQHEIAILAYHNRRLCQYGLAKTLADRVNEGCRVALLSLSPESPLEMLDLVRTMLPLAPATAEEMKGQLERNSVELVKCLRQEVHDKAPGSWMYLRYARLPRTHMVRVDDQVYVGVVAHLEDSNRHWPQHEGRQMRPYIVVPTDSRLGELFLEEFQAYLDCSVLVDTNSPRGSGRDSG